MFNLQDKNFMDSVQELELGIFIDNVTNSLPSTTAADFKDGNVLYRTSTNTKPMQDILKKYHVMTDRGEASSAIHIDHPRRYSRSDSGTAHDSESTSSYGLFKNVTDQIIQQATNATWKECMIEIESYRALAGNNFYGAVLRSTTKESIILNPYHLLTALSLMDENRNSSGIDFETHKFNIIVYFYKDREEMDRRYETNRALKEHIDGNLFGLLASFGNKTITEYKVISMGNPSMDGTIDIKYAVKKAEGEDTSAEYLLSAHQLIARGVMAPYYGTSLIASKLTSATGNHISPFRSPNISNNDSDTLPNTPQNFNVCTGSEDKSLKGLRKLTHCNLGSAYTSNLICSGALAYADAMIEMCADLYTQTGILSESK